MQLSMQLIADWLVAYFVHSTVVCLSALVIAVALKSEPKLRDLVWKASLILPLASATAAVALPSLALYRLPISSMLRSEKSRAPYTAAVSIQGGRSTIGRVEVRHRSDASLSEWIVIASAVAGSLGCILLVVRRKKFNDRVRRRIPVSVAALGVDASLCQIPEGRLRASVADAVESAVILRDGEVCVSKKFFSLLSAERESIIAHELVHIERHDRSWIGFADALSAVFLLQPLLRMVGFRLRGDAELIADELAISRTGNAYAFVSALTRFAEFLEPPTVVAYHDSQVLQRAKLAMAGRTTRNPGRIMKLSVVLAAAAMASGLLALPRILTGESGRKMRVEIRERTTASVSHRVDVSVAVGSP